MTNPISVRNAGVVLSLLGRRVAALLSVVVLLWVAGTGMAQQNTATRGGLGGVVFDATGAVVAGAKVTITGPQGTATATSGSAGQFSVAGLTPGMYSIAVEATGFKKFVSNGNEVVIDHTSSLDVHLSVGNTAETVVVDGGVVQIDTENLSVNTAITDTFYNTLPLPRNVSGAFYVAPGVVTGGGTGTANPSIGGSSGLENLYIADGVTITDQAYGGLGVYNISYGSLGSGINLSFVKEVDIKTAAFEPKYGQADGGIIEIVTKSGSNQYHGALNAYMTPGWTFANRKQLYQYNYLVTTPTETLASPQYEGSIEIGGYVPHFKDKLFFFGSFDPTLSQNIRTVSGIHGAAFAALPPFTYDTTSRNWAGKLSLSPVGSLLVEASSYGDPSGRNSNPNTLTATNVTAVSSSYVYGTRNSILRVSDTLFPWMTVFGSYSYNHSTYAESPSANTYSISDRVGQSLTPAQPIVPYGFGQYYKTKDNSWQLQGETAVKAKFFGMHNISVGYLYNYVDYDNIHSYSGPGYAIPSTNKAGTTLVSLYPTLGSLPPALGKATTATFYLLAAGTTAANGCTYCANYRGEQVYLQQERGSYAGATVATLSRYEAAYGEDSYTFNKYVNVNLGLRWEQQTYGGPVLTYYWRDNWSPRLGVDVDPFGDRKSKVYFAYSRYQIPLPLDAAVRVLGNEQDDTSFYFAPLKDGSGNAILDSTGAVQPDTSAPLNGTAKTSSSKFGAPSFTSSASGVGFEPGTKMEYSTEYILGIDREITPGIIMKMSYTDRQLGRLVEDIQPFSPEGSLVDGGYFDEISNPNASSDFSVNEKEVTYTPAQFAAANGGRSPGQVTTANYVAPAAGCTYANDTSVQNGQFFQHSDGSNYNGACVLNASVAGTTTNTKLGGDGIPDGYANGRRRYQAFEVELDRALRHHWQARINYRYAQLWGNYEGFFRNDNGQSDPGISSLFDFELGALNLLGGQYTRGYLNTDRRNVANALVSYTVDHTTPYVGKLNGLTVGTWLHATTGNPLTALASHPIYLDPGEVPIGGRGTGGTLPTAIQLDLHLDQAVHFAEKYTLRMAFDGFNVADSQPKTGQNQNLDTSPGVANLDTGKPTAFQTAFSARFKLGLEF